MVIWGNARATRRLVQRKFQVDRYWRALCRQCSLAKLTQRQRGLSGKMPRGSKPCQEIFEK
eukprot:7101359-Lingulodinium_polyedra.AAC.1